MKLIERWVRRDDLGAVTQSVILRWTPGTIESKNYATLAIFVGGTRALNVGTDILIARDQLVKTGHTRTHQTILQEAR